MGSHVFHRQRRGFYATADFRFTLEFRGSVGRWALLECGELVGYKPSASPLAQRDRSPIWYQNNTARAAVAWAKHRISDDAINTRAKEMP